MISALTRKTPGAAALGTLIATSPGMNAAHEPEKTGAVTLTNAFEIPPGRLDETIAFWEKARGVLETQPGHISTRLRQSMSPRPE